ncbi:MAG: hypothetical protein OSB45_09430 [Pseudomonadales bacterium]|nr:hypothetical protein [Pseudomonadales bacterium]
MLEQNFQGEAGDAKCNTVSARTMEGFWRIGIADATDLDRNRVRSWIF